MGGAQNRRHGINVEKEAVEYFDPWKPRDDFQSKRDHGETWDFTITDCDGEAWYVECKGEKWKKGPRGMYTVLDNALDQLEGRINHDRRFAVWKPKYAGMDHALVMYPSDRGRIIMIAWLFRRNVLKNDPELSCNADRGEIQE